MKSYRNKIPTHKVHNEKYINKDGNAYIHVPQFKLTHLACEGNNKSLAASNHGTGAPHTVYNEVVALV
jgi:hypothetical protein